MGTILIIDEDINTQNNVGIYLEDEGFEVLLAGTAQEARVHLDSMKEQDMDVVIMETRVKDHTLDELVVEIREHSPACLVLLHTGALDYELSEILRKHGITETDVLIKSHTTLSVLSERITTFMYTRNL